jgi:hypothetical protein
MPMDAPPPMGPPPPTAGMPPAPGPTQVDALSTMAGMPTGGMDVVSTLRLAAEYLAQAAQMAQSQGDMPTAAQLAQALNTVTTVAQTQLQGPLAGPMAANGMGAPPMPGPSAGPPGGMSTPTTPTPAMLPG